MTEPCRLFSAVDDLDGGWRCEQCGRILPTWEEAIALTGLYPDPDSQS